MKMRLRPFSLVFAVAILFSADCFAQKIPVVIEALTTTNQDQTAMRVSKSLSDEIQLSGKFYYWTGKSSEFPANGVRIVLRSVQVKLTSGAVEGSAIFFQATLASSKDPGYYKVITEQVWFIPNGDPIADDVRSFLATVDRKLEGS